MLDSEKVCSAQTARERLGKCRITERKTVGKRIYVFNGCVYVFSHSLDDAAAVLAVRTLSVLAEFAFSAAPVGVNGYAVARLEFGNALADRVDNARHLVTECNGIGDLSRVFLALYLVVVAAANAAISDLNANLACSQIGKRKIADGYVFWTVKYNCFHCFSPLLKCRADDSSKLRKLGENEVYAEGGRKARECVANDLDGGQVAHQHYILESV